MDRQTFLNYAISKYPPKKCECGSEAVVELQHCCQYSFILIKCKKCGAHIVKQISDDSIDRHVSYHGTTKTYAFRASMSFQIKVSELFKEWNERKFDSEIKPKESQEIFELSFIDLLKGETPK